MPIYEFYCQDCHTIFNFFSRRINTDTRPACPRCGRPELERQVSLFAVSKGRKEDDSDDPFSGMDESKMENAVMGLAAEMEGVDENNPKDMARMMRKLYDSTGLAIGDGMQEAIQRMESGEDPDRIEEEMGDMLEEEDPFKLKKAGGLQGFKRKYLPPEVDETLYDL